MRAALLALLALRLSAAAFQVDHITFCGANLPEMRQMLASVGIPTEYGGAHSNGLTEMALSSFQDGSYLELIAPLAGADPSSHYWSRFMKANAGPCAWAIRGESPARLEQRAAKLNAAGIAALTEKAGRKRADGIDLLWETARLGPPPQGSFFPFLIADQTPRDLRAFPSGHPAGSNLAAVRYVVVAVTNLFDAIAKYRLAFGLPAPQRQDDPSLGAHLAWFPQSPVILASPSAPDAWLALRLKQFGQAPCAFVLAAPSWPARSPSSAWFGHAVVWLDSHKLAGARIAIAK
ncbi:MAG TPA: VOC family protein [Bryobacteraceae bacterium]|nr:VOC family protein [Bryobacteraceae bacterium]